ncbi:hypothetical protein DFQ07_2739 [Tenacibaculum caenipelagi]|uniref:Uncharacterized protein n=1 Tax=Tenacibaculum caenipelagi TaxID=1325435 RepID=A0A4R6TF45_9FLAO|nr:hypothetical protein DFQ07_2739 [Tenacibaculum caenipelagi]
MKIRLNPSQKKRNSKTKTSKFLFLPLLFKGEMYWLERVIIKKNFNGRSFQVTDIIRSKDLINNEINKTTNKLKVLKKVV